VHVSPPPQSRRSCPRSSIRGVTGLTCTNHSETSGDTFPCRFLDGDLNLSSLLEYSPPSCGRCVCCGIVEAGSTASHLVPGFLDEFLGDDAFGATVVAWASTLVVKKGEFCRSFLSYDNECDPWPAGAICQRAPCRLRMYPLASFHRHDALCAMDGTGRSLNLGSRITLRLTRDKVMAPYTSPSSESRWPSSVLSRWYGRSKVPVLGPCLPPKD
jgi:hypothetical protein